MAQPKSTSPPPSYKPCTINEYKQTAQQNYKMGGLGPNIGTEEWERGRKKQEIYSEFGKQIRLQNLNKQAQVKKAKPERAKELSRREKAIEYANSVLRQAKPPGAKE